jgi:hypothetical protein
MTGGVAVPLTRNFSGISIYGGDHPHTHWQPWYFAFFHLYSVAHDGHGDKSNTSYSKYVIEGQEEPRSQCCGMRAAGRCAVLSLSREGADVKVGMSPRQDIDWGFQS